MKLSYGWVVVGAGMLMTCIGIGAMLSLAVFLQPIAADTGWSRSGISAAATLDFLCMGAAAFLWGILSDRFGTRIGYSVRIRSESAGILAPDGVGTQN